MTKEKMDRIKRMIEKEVTRYNLTELCEEWGVTVDDYDTFIEYAFRYFDLQD